MLLVYVQKITCIETLVCTGCLIKRHLSLRRWCQQTLKTWHEHSKLSSSSVRWQSDDTRDGKADGNNTGEKSNVESTTAAQEDTRDQAKTVPSEDTSQPTGSTNPGINKDVLI